MKVVIDTNILLVSISPRSATNYFNIQLATLDEFKADLEKLDSDL